MGLCYPMGMLASLTFGSLISATDPVTVLAVFQALGVKVDLFSMVFGESVLNDAVAIVLSRTLLSFKEPGAVVDQESIGAALALFLTIFLGSMFIGILAGIASAMVFKVLNLRKHDELIFTEGALSFVFPWMAYFIAEALSWSGIVAIMFCGIVMASYTRNNFSPEAVVRISSDGFLPLCLRPRRNGTAPVRLCACLQCAHWKIPVWQTRCSLLAHTSALPLWRRPLSLSTLASPSSRSRSSITLRGGSCSMPSLPALLVVRTSSSAPSFSIAFGAQLMTRSATLAILRRSPPPTCSSCGSQAFAAASPSHSPLSRFQIRISPLCAAASITNVRLPNTLK